MVEALKPLLSYDNIAIVVLGLALLFCASTHIMWRKEDRADRLALMKALEKNTEAVNALRLAVSLALNRPV